MKNQLNHYHFSLFVLLFCIALVTSCLELNDSEIRFSQQILGKWNLVRIEEPLKTVTPPTDSTQIRLEFAPAADNNAQQAGATFRVRGENLLNTYSGSATFESTSKAGDIAISSLGTTKRGGPARHMAFDDYYLQLLKKATDYSVTAETLIIWTEDEDMLLFVR